MWDENELNGVDFIPEPSDSRILSAADTTTRGHQDGWRSEVIGWNPLPVPVVSRPRRNAQRVANVGIFMLIVLILWAIWRTQLLIIEIPPPTSEWAYEDSGVRDLQDMGYTGEGVRLCMVDTGIDVSHPDLTGLDLVFKDFITGSSEPTERGSLAHGTMMAGILVADGYLQGIAPDVTLGMAAALGDDGDGGNSGDQNVVASAIEWCWKTFDADIISLSLGGESDPDADRDGPTTNAVRLAMANGVFVIAAAGNDGGEETDDDVEAPCNERDVICVGGVDKDGDSWRYSSRGDNNGRLNPPLFPRFNPDKKPEVVAPAEDVPVALPGNSWGTASGTSAATVYLTGAISLLLEGRKDMQREGSAGGEDAIRSVKEWIMDSSKPKNGQSEHDDRYGYGMLQTRAFLDLAGVSID